MSDKKEKPSASFFKSSEFYMGFLTLLSLAILGYGISLMPTLKDLPSEKIYETISTDENAFVFLLVMVISLNLS